MTTSGQEGRGVSSSRFRSSSPIGSSAAPGLVAPLVGLVVATTVTVLSFSQRGVESDPFGMHALLFGPILLGGTVVSGLVEFGVRTLAG